MPRTRSEEQKGEEEPQFGYLVRSYDHALMPDGSAGYYFSRQEVEDVKRKLEERYPLQLFTIEVFVLPDTKSQGSRQRLRYRGPTR